MIDLQAPLLIAPAIKGLFGNPYAPADLGDGLLFAQSDFGFAQLGEDLFDGDMAYGPPFGPTLTCRVDTFKGGEVNCVRTYICSVVCPTRLSSDGLRESRADFAVVNFVTKLCRNESRGYRRNRML